MSKQDNDSHLDRMFSQFVAKRGLPVARGTLPPSRGAPPPPPGYQVFPHPPPPQPPAVGAPGSSSALRRSHSYAVGYTPSHSASNSSSHHGRPQERKRARPIAPGPPPGPTSHAYPPISPMAPPSGSSLYRGVSSHVPQQAAVETKSFPCPDCRAPFPSRGQLSRHVKRVHEGLKPFACEFCGRLFAARSDRSRHIGNMHKDGKKVG